MANAKGLSDEATLPACNPAGTHARRAGRVLRRLRAARAVALGLAMSLVLPCLRANELAPVLRAEPSPTGSVSWWLAARSTKQPMETPPPENAREGEALSVGAAEKWSVLISPTALVDLRPYASSRAGLVWAATRYRCEIGGKRAVRLRSYCGVRVYLGKTLVLEKPQPDIPVMDETEAQVDFPQGVSELTVAVGIRSGYAIFQLNVCEHKRIPSSKPVAGDSILVPLAAGQEPDVGAAALRAATFHSDGIFATPQQPTTVELGFFGSLPLDLGPLTARFLAPDGKPFADKLPPRTALELNTNTWRAQFSAPEKLALRSELTAEVFAGAKLLGTKKVELYSLQAFSAAAREAEADVSARATRAGRAFPFAALALEKLKLYLTKIEMGEERISRDLGSRLLELLNSVGTFAASEEQGQDPCAGKTGYFERAYTSRLDEQPQPYFVLVPPSVTQPAQKKERYPLIIFLHGYVPSYDKHRWWDEMLEFNASIERQDAFMAIPFGRSNTDFQSCGEVDVLDVIAEMKRLYPIDAERIYLYGYSMGGMAVYSVAAHYPDVFAAAVVFCGRADSPLQNFKPLSEFHPYKQWLIHNDNPISLCENLLNIPVRIYHGRSDFIINVKEAQRMEQRLKEIGCDAQLMIYPSDHWAGFDMMGDDAIVKWLLQHKRATQPPQRKLKSYSLRFARQAEVEVRATTGELDPIEVQWSNKQGALELQTPRAAQILQLNFSGRPHERFAAVPEGGLKTPELCGPVREAICGPFLIAYGTSGSPQAMARNKENSERFAQEWYAFTRSRAILKADKDVTEQEKQNRNLFLFGEEQENLLHAAAAAHLPFVVKNGTARLGERSVALQGKGMMYIYPNPFAPAPKKCSVVICTGLPYGRSIGVNHKLDLLPDFIIYTDQTASDSTGANVPVVAGFFDGRWKLNPRTTWWFDQ